MVLAGCFIGLVGVQQRKGQRANGERKREKCGRRGGEEGWGDDNGIEKRQVEILLQLFEMSWENYSKPNSHFKEQQRMFSNIAAF